IRVCTIAPGIMDTPLLGGLRNDVRASLEASVPHPRRLGSPAEFGALACGIVENPYLNGEPIRLDGAIRLAPRGASALPAPLRRAGSTFELVDPPAFPQHLLEPLDEGVLRGVHLLPGFCEVVPLG